MKILFKVLLAFLLVLCIGMAVVFTVYFSGVESDKNAEIASREEQAEPEPVVFSRIYEDEYIRWQRELVRPEDSYFWHYYPTIPTYLEPGETVVLDAYAFGFIRWETDEDSADVEFFDMLHDEDKVYVSFIMPEEPVVVRALYDDIIFEKEEPEEDGSEDGNNEEQEDTWEIPGDHPFRPLDPPSYLDNPSSGDGQPADGFEPPNYERQPHNNLDGDESSDGYEPPSGGYEPPSNGFSPPSSAAASQPDGFEPPGFERSPPGSFSLSFDDISPSSGLLDPFSAPITILSAPILTANAMIPGIAGSGYSTLISVNGLQDLPPGVVTYAIDPDGPLPTWLSFNPLTLRILTPPGVPIPTTPPSPPGIFPYNVIFYILVTYTNAEFPELNFTQSVEFGFSVVENAGITTESPLPKGMVGQPYNYKIEVAGLPDGSTMSLIPAGGSLPPGLDINTTTGVISTNPTLTTAGTFTFSYRLMTTVPNPSNPTNPIVNTTAAVDFELEVLARPMFTSFGDFEDGIESIAYANYNDINTNVPLALEATGTGSTWSSSTTTQWVIEADNIPPSFSLIAGANPNQVLLASKDKVLESDVGEYGVTFTLTSNDSTNPNLDGVVINMPITTELIDLKLWPLPKFVPIYDELPVTEAFFKLPDGMDKNPDNIRYHPNEPVEKPYSADIRTSGEVYTVTDWTWDVNGNNLPVSPPGSPGVLPTGAGGPTGLSWNMIDETHAFIFGTEYVNTSGDTMLTFTLTADDTNNDNIAGARISQPYRLRTWERRYLYIDIEDTTGYVIRKGENTAWEPGWIDSAWRNSAASIPYREKRAVMPGSEGEIMTLLTTGFVRWEVRDDGPYDTPDANEYVWILDKYRLEPVAPARQTNAIVTIEMPSHNGTTFIDDDVYIRGIHTRDPVITASLQPRELLVGDMYPGVISIMADSDIGEGRFTLSDGSNNNWEILPGGTMTTPPNVPFPGVMLVRNAGNITSITGTPLIDGTFTFTVGLTLPGTMRIDRTYSVKVDPIPGIMLGDVNGDGQRNLYDLVMLARYFRSGGTIVLPNPDAANIVTPKGSDPSGDDLDILSRYFARLDASLPTPPS